MTQIVVPKGGSANFLINMGFDISGCTWDVMEMTGAGAVPTPSVSTVSATAGTARFYWTRAQTENTVRGKKASMRLRLTLSNGDAIPFPPITVTIT